MKPKPSTPKRPKPRDLLCLADLRREAGRRRSPQRVDRQTVQHALDKDLRQCRAPLR